MFFKNLIAYRIPVGWTLTTEQLAQKPLIECGSFDSESRGWIPIPGTDELVHQVGQHQLICLGMESKVLPASVVKHEVEERARAIEEDQGYKPGRKQRQELRDNVTAELLAQAFIARRRTFAWIDTQNGWLVVDASSATRAEDVLEHLRQTLDHFPLALLRTELSPSAAMAKWLAEDEAPEGFSIDQSCILQSVTEDHAKVRYDNHSLSGDEIKEHLLSCKVPTRLALTFDDRISFVLTERLEIKRLEFLDIVRDQISGDEDDAQALFDAEFALMAGESAKLLNALADEIKNEEGCVTQSAEAVEDAAERLDCQTVTINRLREQRDALLSVLHHIPTDDTGNGFVSWGVMHQIRQAIAFAEGDHKNDSTDTPGT